MKALMMILCLLNISTAQAAWHALPQADISARTINGVILLVQMKHNLIIQGQENLMIAEELGFEGREKFYNDIIMDTNTSKLRVNYSGKNNTATNAVITRYENFIEPQKTLSLR